MEYLVRRGEQQFGPYTLAELQEYAQSGRILQSDVAKSDGLNDWVPVSQILGNIPAPVAAPVAVAAPVQTVPLPPNLHWAILLIILIAGRIFGLLFLFFNWAWSLLLANWARRLVNNNTAMVLVAMYPAGFLAGAFTVGFGGAAHMTGVVAVGGILILAGVIAYIVGIFKIRDAMEEYYNTKENIALTLSGVMTFFFSTVYLQYHINRIARWKKTGILS
jgi:GYF domain 2